MELIGAAAVRRSLASMYPVAPRGRRRRMPARVSCVGRGGEGFADAAPRKAMEAAVRDLGKLRAMGFVSGDAGKKKILSRRDPMNCSLGLRGGRRLQLWMTASDGLGGERRPRVEHAARLRQGKDLSIHLWRTRTLSQC